MLSIRLRSVFPIVALLLITTAAWPWGNDGHSAINRVAAEKLPADVPSFLRQAAEQLAYIAPEPDRWREKGELALKLSQEPDHFIDLERVEGMLLPADRYSFYRMLEEKHEATPGKPDYLLPEKVGLQPYIVMETYERLIVAFREYRHALRDHQSPEYAERDAIFYAGWLGHYVGDGANPLHTTVQYNGWIGDNPKGYTTANTVHWKIEGLFVADNIKGLQFAGRVSATPQKLDHPFHDYLTYLQSSHEQVERCYQLEKQGGFDGEGTAESREFLEQRLAAGAEMLRNLWYTAWVMSAQDPPPWVPNKPAEQPANAPPANMHTVPKLEDQAPSPVG